MNKADLIRIGTCSWKYDSWEGLVYCGVRGTAYLEQYSQRYNTVEVDQWFWSLFQSNQPVLPKAAVVQEYADSVPPGFLFSIKVPNSITLTHHYSKSKGAALIPNPYFLSIGLMERFLETIQPLGEHIGPLMFQFEYLSKMKMANLRHFLDHFEVFRHNLPEGYTYCIEIRNPNWLQDTYFQYLADHRLGHVFLQGYYMPSIFEVYWKFKESLAEPVVIRLHGPGRAEIEQLTGNVWNRIVEPKDFELLELSRMVGDLEGRGHQVFINVNNHYEGSAPRTIDRIKARLLE